LAFQENRNAWFCENFGEGKTEINDAEMKHTVYIERCNNATIMVNTKVKNVQIASCKDTQVLVHGAVSGVEITNCTKIKLQALHSVPSFAIDKSNGVTIILSKENMDAEFVTSKSGEMNVLYPNAEDDYSELPLPEQFVHKIKDGKVTSEVSGLY